MVGDSNPGPKGWLVQGFDALDHSPVPTTGIWDNFNLPFILVGAFFYKLEKCFEFHCNPEVSFPDSVCD
jgi:hypothetical protein